MTADGFDAAGRVLGLTGEELARIDGGVLACAAGVVFNNATLLHGGGGGGGGVNDIVSVRFCGPSEQGVSVCKCVCACVCERK